MMRRIHLLSVMLTILATAEPIRAEPPAKVRTDRYGDPLPPGALVRLGTVRMRQQRRFFAFSPDSKHIASLSFDGYVHFWSTATGREQRRLGEGRAGGSGRIAYSPDGKLLAVQALQDIHVFDAATGKCIRKLPRPKKDQPDEFVGLTFSPDGKLLAAGEETGGITLWNTKTGVNVRQLDTRQDKLGTLAFLPDGKRLLAVDREGVVRVWDTDGRQLRKFGMGLQLPFSLAVAADGQTLVRGVEGSFPKLLKMQSPEGGLVSVWDISTGKEIRGLDTAENVVGIALAPDGKTLAYSEGAAIHLRDMVSWKEIRRIDLTEGTAFNLAFSPDGKTLAAHVESTLQLWDVATGRLRAPGMGHASPVDRLAFLANGRQLVSISRNQRIGTARVWDTFASQHLYRLPEEWNWTDLGIVCPSRDGGMLFLGDMNTITLWDVTKRRAVRRFALEEKITKDSGLFILALALAPDGRRLTSLSLPAEGGGVTIQMWDIASGEKLSRRTLDLPEPLRHHPTLSPDGRLMATTDDRRIWLRDAVSGAIRQTLPLEKPADDEAIWGRLVFSHDGRLLACISRPEQGLIEDAASTKGKVRIWELATGKELPPLAAPWTQAIAVAPDGRTLASGGGAMNDRGTLEKPIRLWDIATGKEIGSYQGHEAVVGSLFMGSAGAPLAFSPDGQTLATGLMDSTVLLWDLKPALRRLKASLPAARAEDLQRLWADLAGEDARKAQASLRAMAATPDIALPFLEQRLKPASAADPELLRRLIADLDSEQFAVRKAATEELRKFDLLAEPALQKALKGKPSLESRRRIEELLAFYRGPVVGDETRRMVRAVAVLEYMKNEGASRLLKKLTAGAPEARLTREATAALERVRPPSP